MNPTLSAFLSQRLIDRKGGHRRSVLNTYDEQKHFNQLSRGEIEQWQRDRVAALLSHARAHVPWCAEHLSSEQAITADNAMDVLSRMPMMRRADVQQRPEAFLGSPDGERVADATGGSTGTPMTFYVDRPTQVARESSLYWANSLAGWSYGDRVAMLWGSDKDVSRALGGVRESLRWKLENMSWFNAFNMGEQEMGRFHERLCAFQPHVIVAYASVIWAYANYLKDNALQPNYPLTSVVSSAEVMTVEMREQVERIFRRPVYDRYGNREMGALAASCGQADTLHINERDCLIEIDSASPYEQEGQLVVTYLHNRAMPFIRYATGDLACLVRPSQCSCGRTTLRISPVIGRKSDLISVPSGKVIHGEWFTHVLYGVDAVKQFQFVQHSLERYELLLVANEARVSSELGHIEQSIREAIGEAVMLEIRFVNKIEPLASGKHKFTISHLDRLAEDSQ